MLFIVGTHTTRSRLHEYGDHPYQCHHCGNIATYPTKSREWFTFCYIPVIPFSISGDKDLVCNICRFAQPISSRPDVSSKGAPPPPQQQWAPHPGQPQQYR